MARRPERLILASASSARASLLRGAGLEFTIEPADLDEAAIKRDVRIAGGSAADCAASLAREKASHISRGHADALVIGADQVLVSGEEWFDKPRDLGEARDQLRKLRGMTHRLATAVSVARAGSPAFDAVSIPELTMRRFSDAFLDAYLAAEGEALLCSVGAYRLEGQGVQLFERINGDYFAVLGLPLLEVLTFLREQGAAPV